MLKVSVDHAQKVGIRVIPSLEDGTSKTTLVLTREQTNAWISR
jgi:hypothetical protein